MDKKKKTVIICGQKKETVIICGQITSVNKNKENYEQGRIIIKDKRQYTRDV